MGKIYSTMAHALTRVFALCLLLVAGMSAAQAADTVEYGALELNKAYELKASTLRPATTLLQPTAF